ncbi:MAG: stage V sporulation protein AB [Lachnospiraceae bacterium]|nr:stage V sporulation protein AB [Lachnospiraceae bacterium]
MGQILAVITGFASGFLVAGGVASVMIGLGILTRFIGISHTARQILWYEDAIFLGAVVGDVVTVFDFKLAVGAWMLVIAGLFIGIFIGGWIMALAEIVEIFPVYSRRLGITRNVSWMVIALAAGKVVGSLIFFFGHMG